MLKKTLFFSFFSFLSFNASSAIVNADFEVVVSGGTFDGVIGTGTIQYDDVDIGFLPDGDSPAGVQYGQIDISLTVFGQTFTQEDEAAQGVPDDLNYPYVYVGGPNSPITGVNWGIFEANAFPDEIYRDTEITQSGIAGLELLTDFTLRNDGVYTGQLTVNEYSAVPIPAAAWLFGSALVGLAGIKRRK
ncbi:putative secreted protein [Sinobacterium caligoides]|uniref:Putative secreted protein n=1 Tax=Sinobacterium caligoides TaxID=933926 RepID=A0A3N2E0H2_9GAMM|nr:VPLPA-CTERM sorting domain-containing protein [Sinobacterium caligoides]ROS05594.1 putative secreted protein [Sinobacterium caligoides]